MNLKAVPLRVLPQLESFEVTHKLLECLFGLSVAPVLKSFSPFACRFCRIFMAYLYRTGKKVLYGAYTDHRSSLEFSLYSGTGQLQNFMESYSPPRQSQLSDQQLQTC